MGQRMVDVAVMRQVLLRTCDRCGVVADAPEVHIGGAYLPYTPAAWLILRLNAAGPFDSTVKAQCYCSPACLVDAVTERMERGSGG